MTYDGTLVMPSSYAAMDEDEMMYLEGGFTLTVATTIKMMFAAGGITYGAGVAVGSRVGWMSTKAKVKRWYSSIKWPLRAGLLAANPIYGAIALVGFENGLYSTLNIRK